MKKLLLISSLMLSASLMANDYNYEITPLVGYNFSEGNLKLDNTALYGVELQYNDLDSIIKPEFSVLYSDTDYDNSSLDTDIYRFALNGVYEFDKISSFTPLVKAGIGYETIDNTYGTENSDGAFLDAGIGAKISFAKNIALKLEAIYMLKDGVKGSDNNFATLMGLNFAFGAKAQRKPEVTPEPEPQPEPAVRVKPKPKPVIIDGDDDKDGILNSLDKCPTTPQNQVVDAMGCMLIVNLHINFRTNSYKVDSPSNTNLTKFAEFLKLKPNYNAQIIGYTDSKGKASFNKTLSLNRANTVKKLLEEKGI